MGHRDDDPGLDPRAAPGAHYAWVSGPDEGYGFGASGAERPSLAQHRENIHDFLAQVDPATGFIGDD